MEIKCCLRFKDASSRRFWSKNNGSNASNAGNDGSGGFIETFWDTLLGSPIAELARFRCVLDWWIIHQDGVQSSSRGLQQITVVRQPHSTQGMLLPLPADLSLVSFNSFASHWDLSVVARVTSLLILKLEWGSNLKQYIL